MFVVADFDLDEEDSAEDLPFNDKPEPFIFDEWCLEETALLCIAELALAVLAVEEDDVVDIEVLDDLSLLEEPSDLFDFLCDSLLLDLELLLVPLAVLSLLVSLLSLSLSLSLSFLPFELELALFVELLDDEDDPPVVFLISFCLKPRIILGSRVLPMQGVSGVVCLQFPIELPMLKLLEFPFRQFPLEKRSAT